MDVKEHKPSTTSSAGIFDGAHNNQIDGAKFSNVGGNSTVTSFSTTYVIIKQESGHGIGVRSAITLLILVTLAFLLFRLL
jgi:hypothetical protein